MILPLGPVTVFQPPRRLLNALTAWLTTIPSFLSALTTVDSPRKEQHRRDTDKLNVTFSTHQRLLVRVSFIQASTTRLGHSTNQGNPNLFVLFCSSGCFVVLLLCLPRVGLWLTFALCPQLPHTPCLL
ncbi:hypothetical protein JAAARDRAFT_623863 [Jaapia argillacea MUCL 33604]|uniref:Uncharacterized protein n=1 Tax=Jaapia argillacea MUCL 33604 TaxID=933084 RepID=A0A067PXH0_9AGAM|nr:hypothetical protein JAAARDRAFT_623863 [Jaapia argillacea MUCL 33604]